MSLPCLRTASYSIASATKRQCSNPPHLRPGPALTLTDIHTFHTHSRSSPPPPRHIFSKTQTTFFSTKSRDLASAREPNYYEVLDVPITASQGEIKKKFYTLSMRHHPDRNRDDPTASSRFARISSAYNVLSHPNKRAAYDRDHGIYAQYQNTHSTATAGQHPMGSYSSHGANLHTKGASYAGSRPASGLSNRRGTFRGPPPSFYANGGYGRTGRTNPGPGSAKSGGGGSAAGQNTNPKSDDDPTSFIDRNTVHHFNARGHYKTQTAEDMRRKERKERATHAALNNQYLGSPWAAAMRFAAVCGILAGAATVAGFVQWPGEKARKQKDQLIS
ncbi:DnaJ domain protein [Aspergillus saccharolyticus JOP 1030-1]|uniref:DnaJ-domain-containing protein n=1 Tax=Aspergillus saccharolyticus JOP 1030-1 TaxID=1450539 RepID=A0A318ZCW6_9EURO|nr:DnaJ-domain-containing protein [Aspergillus saccharolyticus JOP 1030-1]PYH45175.1 DnaJ-domain-containing protein [Aspergillus saccharolyticus JOP 1030-1]